VNERSGQGRARQNLTEPKNALLKQYQRLFEFEMYDCASRRCAGTVAELALQRKVGARGLRMILEDLMLELMYHLPMQRKVRELRGHADMVRTREINWSFARKGRKAAAGESTRAPMFNREKQELKRVRMMPVRDMVIFPQQMTPFIVGREASVRALEEALAGDKKIFLSSSTTPRWMIQARKIYAVGTLANIVQSVSFPTATSKSWSRCGACTGHFGCRGRGFLRATVRPARRTRGGFAEVKQIVEKVTGLYEQFSSSFHKA